MTGCVNIPTSQQFAITTEVFEVLSVASLMNGMLVFAAYQFYLFYNHSINKIDTPFLLMTFAMILIQLMANGPLLTSVVISTTLLVLIDVVCTTLVIINYTK